MPRAERPVRPEQPHELNRARSAKVYVPKPAASAVACVRPAGAAAAVPAWRSTLVPDGVHGRRDRQIHSRNPPLALLSPAAITGREGNEKSA